MWKDKLCSGKFWLAVLTGVVFILCSLGVCGAVALSAEQITGIIMIVFVSYFNKPKVG